MTVLRTPPSDSGLMRVQVGGIPRATTDNASQAEGVRDRGGGALSTNSYESLESSSIGDDDGDEYKPAHPHHLKLLALSEVLMRSPVSSESSKSNELACSSSMSRNNSSSIGLLEEARHRWRGRKERCVHWDTVEIDGREFPLQRADTSSAAQRSTTPSTGGAGGGGGGLAGSGAGRSIGHNKSSDPAAGEPSYLLVGHSTCDMCLMTYEASSVSGVITMKRILKARQDWGLAESQSKKYAAASSLYEPARLCALCSQFFCSKGADGRGGGGEGGELVPLGVGRSDEHVSLTLESMASNKPLPDKSRASLAAAAPGARGPTVGGSSSASRTAVGSGGGSGRPLNRRRRRDPSGRGGDSTTSSSGGALTNNSGNARAGAEAASNFRLDELIADDRFVVKETDLARQSGAVASQSSTADGMGADVCMGFPAAKRLGGTHGNSNPTEPTSRSPMSPQQRQRGSSGGGVRVGDPETLPVCTPDGSSTIIESSLSSSVTTTGDRGSLGSASNISVKSSQSVTSPPAVSPAAAVPRTMKTTETAPLILQTHSTPASATPTKKIKKPLPPKKMRADEAAAAAAAAARTCSRTRRENQPWWEVDLGGAFPVRCIRVHHPDRRTEATKAGASPFVDVSPFWIMTSARAIGEASPEEAKELALSSKRVGSHGKITVWNLGVNHFAAAVRVQAEGVKSLQLAR